MEQPSEGLDTKDEKWELSSETTPGRKIVAHHALGDKTKIYLPQLHVKLSLIKTPMKRMDK
jgi:hypothetical protein